MIRRPRVIAFVDGENLLWRYQALLKNGLVPKSGVVHNADSFVWCESVLEATAMDLVRITYYTSAVGGQNVIEALEARIAAQSYQESTSALGFLQLVPRVFKREKRETATRVVDIAITMDVMRCALTSDVDALLLFTGDGDFVQLVHEVTRNTSKQIYVFAFSSGLNPDLKTTPDGFRLLDHKFFEP